MRFTPAALLLVAAVAAVGSYDPPAHAETPASSPVRETSTWRPPVAAGPRVEVLEDGMRSLPTFAQAGRTFVLGAVGERYRLHIVNPTASRVEAVVSIDGLDAVDGRPAGTGKRGYVVPAFGEVTVDGWRTSLDTVAAFRFSSVRDSYAARAGRDQNVGVIGVAFFRERAPLVVRRAPAPLPRTAQGPAGAGAGGAPPPPAAREERPGLGTEFGEQHDSHVTEVHFERSSARPDSMFEVRYDDAGGLLARGIRVPGTDPRGDETARRDRAQPFADTRFAQPPR
jgi:hypothetical protein